MERGLPVRRMTVRLAIVLAVIAALILFVAAVAQVHGAWGMTPPAPAARFNPLYAVSGLLVGAC